MKPTYAHISHDTVDYIDTLLFRLSRRFRHMLDITLDTYILGDCNFVWALRPINTVVDVFVIGNKALTSDLAVSRICPFGVTSISDRTFRLTADSVAQIAQLTQLAERQSR